MLKSLDSDDVKKQNDGGKCNVASSSNTINLSQCYFIKAAYFARILAALGAATAMQYGLFGFLAK